MNLLYIGILIFLLANKLEKENDMVISFKKINKKIQIEYTDNGIGAPIDKINLKNGLLNVENRIHVINGTLTFDTTTQKGFRVSITFPI